MKYAKLNIEYSNHRIHKHRGMEDSTLYSCFTSQSRPDGYTDIMTESCHTAGLVYMEDGDALSIVDGYAQSALNYASKYIKFTPDQSFWGIIKMA